MSSKSSQRSWSDRVRALPRKAWQFDLRLTGLNNHVVICGLGRIGVQLARDVHGAGAAGGLVVIERDRNNHHIATCRRLGAAVLIGDAADPAMLRRARVERASQVFAVCGDDSTDVMIAVRLCNLLARRAGEAGRGREGPARPLGCFVHIVDEALKELFVRHPLLMLARNRQVNVKVFNVFTNSARLLIREHFVKDQQQPSPGRRPKENEVAHYVVVGFGQMGQAFALEAARLAHFENHKRLRMTIIDDKDDPQRDRFLARYPRFCPSSLSLERFDPAADDWASKQYRPDAPYQVADDRAVEYACNAEFLEMPPAFRADLLADRIARRQDAPTVCSRIIVCLDDDRRNFEAAVLLRTKLDDRGKNAPLYAWLPVETGLSELLRTGNGPAGTAIGGVIPFGICEQSCNLEEIIRPGSEELARAVHEYYRERFPHPAKPSSKPWDELIEPYRTSNFLVAEHLGIKLSVIGQRRVREEEAPADRPRDTIAEHEERLLGQMEHNRWLAQQLLDGWRYAPERHDERKQDPDLCAWKHLPPERQNRDFEQVRRIPEILKKLPQRECIVPD